MLEYFKTLPQYLLPQHTLSRCMYRIARWRWSLWKNVVIRLFIHHYQVDMDIAEQSDPGSFVSFNDFFTRRLKTTERPVDSTPLSIVSPVDGSISQIGSIDKEAIIQAKNKHFSLRALLANDSASVDPFIGGSFATIYLSPRDYHRIHLATDAELVKMTYVPGDLFSVNDATSRNVDQLFARNERLICLFRTEHGLMAAILVGAIFVGGMETVWQGEITPARPRELRTWDYSSASDTQTRFARGEEMARFNMGSTVILLFEPGRMNWSEALQAGTKVQMGQLIATANSQGND